MMNCKKHVRPNRILSLLNVNRDLLANEITAFGASIHRRRNVHKHHDKREQISESRVVMKMAIVAEEIEYGDLRRRSNVVVILCFTIILQIL
ncbi:hypothetical protein VNO80_00238 [Phaseolus coccineus]|uniref:Uncharacterized protein n=1 Tax=Phaseolus coccineus TaxID=3886 RepID=A0AAN9NZ18_PHACN